MKKLVALVGAGLLLAGCSTDPSSAAVVNGENISIDDLSAVQVDFRNEGTDTLASGVLNLLVSAEITTDIIEAEGLEIPEEIPPLVAMQLGLDENAELSEQTNDMLTYLSFTLATQQGVYTSDEIAPVLDALFEADVEINPRFGEWDSENMTLLPPERDYLIEVPDEQVAAGF